MLRPGISPHDHEPTPTDLHAVGTAEVVIHNGLDLEAFWDDLIAAASPEGTVVDASEGVPVLAAREEPAHERSESGEQEEALEDGHRVGDVDPHIWHDPLRARTMVVNLTEALVQADPGGAEGYRARSGAYLAELGRLDA